ncbi:MAG: DUF4136 domain-containing protein [Bacteroidota bacterium]
MKTWFLLTSVLVLASCASIRVEYDYDKEADFKAYKTYGYYAELNSGLSQLDERRLIRVLDAALVAKGFQYSDTPDFLINVTSETYRNTPQNNVGVGLGGTNNNMGGGISIGLPLGGGAIKRRIQFDFVDAKGDFLFWQATSDSGLRDNAAPDVRESQLQQLVQKVFSKFPPQ